MPFMAFTRGGEAMVGDDSFVTDAMWTTVRLSVRGKNKALFNKQKPLADLDVECDADGKASVFAIWREVYPRLDTTSGGRPLFTMSDFADIHNTIQAHLTSSGFANLSHCVRCCTAHYNAEIEHAAPRDAFAMMVMGGDTWKSSRTTGVLRRRRTRRRRRGPCASPGPPRRPLARTTMATTTWRTCTTSM